MAKVRVRIDGRDVEVEEGSNFIEAARVAGVEIPHFCYHPGLGVDGNCRMCLVEVEGVAKPQIACNTFAREGVEIRTATENVKKLQASVLEFLFLNHPLDCPICDQSGECYLQDYYMSNGRYQSRLDTPKVHKRKAAPVGPRVTLDAERCVLCTRCVRFCDQVSGTGELYIVNRGNRAEITTYPDKPLDNDYSLNTVDICPVGALTNTEFRFKKRVWFLETAESVCAGCARGCNTYLEHSEGDVYRLRPRENMQVNRYWMCDPGRTTYEEFNAHRLDVALASTDGPEQDMLPLDEALARAAGWIETARAKGAVVLLSPASSVETLFAAKQFTQRVLSASPADRPPVERPAAIVGAGSRLPGVEDAILRKSDPYPDREGLRALGLEGDPAPALQRGGGLLVVIEDDPLGQQPDWAAQADRFDHILYLGTNENATSRRADLALPITPLSECRGVFVNFQGRAQRFERGVDPRGDALWAPEMLARLARAAGASFGWPDHAELWRDLAALEPEFKGLDWDEIGDQGALLGSRRGAADPVGSDLAGKRRP